ncbi:unnamed protein product [Lepeophtheirus salmonis]|uniref:(salmon louse) hypothetical protein n=1 Tax=Lepeophtheirus salmonis TaxID=72036 RepID=A0A7R8H3G3_LEPSM|nr:unnamed protein product [Lepeophtheirus salmonis]CAF2842181.1 unnamed protein product [Lepeophtheirus salmonis]
MQKAEELTKDSKAFVSRFRNNGLKKSITEGENEEDIFGNLITNRNYISLKAKFESDEDDIGHRIYQDLEVCLELGEKEYRDEGIIAVDEFLNERNRIQVEYLNFVNEATQGGGGSEEEERSLRKEFDPRNADIRFYRRIVELIESETAVERCKFWREKSGTCMKIFKLETAQEYWNYNIFVDKCKAETEEYDFSSSNAVEEDDVY